MGCSKGNTTEGEMIGFVKLKTSLFLPKNAKQVFTHPGGHLANITCISNFYEFDESSYQKQHQTQI